MKNCLALLLSLGIFSVIADISVIENKDGLLPDIETQSEQIEGIFHNKPVADESIIVTDINDEANDEELAVVQMEEGTNVFTDLTILNDGNSVIYEEQVPKFVDSEEVVNRDPEEIMDTAAGFVPIPIIRRRKQNKRVSTRRNFRRNPYPYRRFYYYPHAFYYPGSLRYY